MAVEMTVRLRFELPYETFDAWTEAAIEHLIEDAFSEIESGEELTSVEVIDVEEV